MHPIQHRLVSRLFSSQAGTWRDGGRDIFHELRVERVRANQKFRPLERLLQEIFLTSLPESTRASVQIAAPRRNGRNQRETKFATARAPSPAREARALPGSAADIND